MIFLMEPTLNLTFEFHLSPLEVLISFGVTSHFIFYLMSLPLSRALFQNQFLSMQISDFNNKLISKLTTANQLLAQLLRQRNIFILPCFYLFLLYSLSMKSIWAPYNYEIFNRYHSERLMSWLSRSIVSYSYQIIFNF